MIFIILSIILFDSSIFYVKNVETVFLSQTNLPDNFDENLIINEVKKGQNIFFADKQKIIQNIHLKYPYIKVISIESVFPDKLKFYLIQRNCFYAVKHKDGYYICDENLGVIEKIATFSSTKFNPIILENLIFPSVKAGSNIPPSACVYISDLSKSLCEWKDDLNILQSYISQIQADYIKKNQILISFFNGCQILVENCENNLSNKLNYAFSYFSQNDIQSGTIKIIDLDNKKTILVYEK